MAKKNNKKKGNNKAATTSPQEIESVETSEQGVSLDQDEQDQEEHKVNGTDIEHNADLIEEAAKDNIEEKVSYEKTSEDLEAQRIKELENQVAELSLKLKEVNSTKSEEPEEDNQDDKDEIEKLKKQLASTEQDKEKVEVQYDQLLTRIGSMKSVFSKMKESQNELEQAQEQLAEYERQNSQLKHKVDQLTKEKVDQDKNIKLLKEEGEALNLECDRLSHDLSNLRADSEAKETIWNTEKRQLTQKSIELTKEVEKLRESNEEYLITLENDKLVNSSLNDEITDLNEKLQNLEDSKDVLEEQLESKTKLIDSLRSDIEKLKSEIKASQENQQNDLNNLNQQLVSANDSLKNLKQENTQLKEESTKVSKLEQEVKEKQLQIGKLRHEAVILNEHLTKALQLIKRNSDSETVDKELISNLFISFLNIPRADTKKFEVLQLISNFLNWDEDKKVQAGISHTGATIARKSQSRESFVSLWTEYLEKESSSST